MEVIERDIRIRYVSRFQDCVEIVEKSTPIVDVNENEDLPSSSDPYPY